MTPTIIYDPGATLFHGIIILLATFALIIFYFKQRQK